MDVKFIFHADAGHGWLAVKRRLLFDLGVAEKITSYSYQKGQTVYLEEDCDASTFLDAYKKKYGTPTINHAKYRNTSPIRNYDCYSL